jgi:hypothetical protein
VAVPLPGISWFKSVNLFCDKISDKIKCDSLIQHETYRRLFSNKKEATLFLAAVKMQNMGAIS